MIGESAGGIKLVPFHTFRNVCHQARSARALLFKCTQWSRSVCVAAAYIRLRKKALPMLHGLVSQLVKEYHASYLTPEV